MNEILPGIVSFSRTTAPKYSAPPSGSSLWQITKVLAWTDFKLRYAGSVLGYFWSVSKPLLMFGVLYVVFTRVMRFGDDLDHYPIMLLFGIVMWSYFTEVTGSSVTILVARADILRKVSIPRIALPLSVALTAGLVMVFNLLSVFAFILLNGVEPRMSWLWLVPLFMQYALLTLGVSLLLSVFYVGLRDIGQAWDLVLQMMFYAVPILYPLTFVPEGSRRWMLANPVGQILQQSREALVGTQSGSYTASMPGLWFFVPYTLTAAIFVVGVVAFHRTAPTVAERL